MRLTNPLWYLAAFLLAIGSTMAATAVAARAFDPVRDATVTPVTERVDAAGSTLAIYTDLVQPDRDILCRGRYGQDDRGRIVIPDKDVDITARGDGTTWHLIALLEDGRGKHFDGELVELFVDSMDEVLEIRRRFVDEPA